VFFAKSIDHGPMYLARLLTIIAGIQVPAGSAEQGYALCDRGKSYTIPRRYARSVSS
jgi:hypothetical protein